MTIEPSESTLEQKASLLSGRDFWSTKPIEEARIPSIVLTDGPHGGAIPVEQLERLMTATTTTANAE